ncbi:MAG TPA: 4-hydroxy-tetrahydrodipicolinate synthase [Ignavibacteria bacterium]|nr:4-hydroxy-tetrahydrodipicolinate synthase [Ignavibacteria bacterium]HMR40932.1 4-hydroxy-tetrahydrodipicolinate synthase [Ignavibacteria bacterium]
MEIKGCGTALITPFKEDQSVDYDVFRSLVKRQIDNGIHFIVPLGTTGETPCLEDDEKLRLLEISVEEAKGKVPVVAGAGSNNTKHVIGNIKEFEKTGVDAFLIVTPYYNKPTQQGMYNHFKAISECTEKKIIMYNVPARTSINMNADTCLRLAELKNIVATKEASSNYDQINEIIRDSPEGFSVLSGNDDETLSLCATGAKGVISVASNLAPKELSGYLNLILGYDFKNAATEHHRLMPLFRSCFVESNPTPAKAGLAFLGLIENILRPPLYPSTRKTFDIMAGTLQNLNIR